MFQNKIVYNNLALYCYNFCPLSCQLSGDVSFVSSIEDDEDKEPTPYNEIPENIYLIDK